MDQQHRLRKLKEIDAEKLFPEFLSEGDKRQLRKLKSVRNKKHSAASNVNTNNKQEPVSQVSTNGLLEPAVDFNLTALVQDLVDPKTGKMRELVDTRSLPRAKNFYDYCFRILGSDIHAPWAVQMWLAVMSLGEVCPRCTNPKYMDVRNIRKDMPSKRLNSPKRMTFLEFGVCPRCGATRRELLHSGEMQYRNQATWILGQRCVTADTMLLTVNGVEEIGNLLRDKKNGYSDFSYAVHNGAHLEQTTLCFAAKPEPLYSVELEDGGSIECTKDHPLMTEHGWKKAADISADDFIEVAVNTQCFGNTIPTWEEAIAFAKNNVKGGSTDTVVFNNLSGKIGADFFILLGLYVAEGSSTTITQKDEVVSAFIERALSYVFANGYKYREKCYAHVAVGHMAYSFFRFFFGDLNKGSYKQEFPRCVLSAPKTYINRFLRGLFEGDGYIDKQGSIHYYTVSRRLADQLRVVLYNLGYYPIIYTKIAQSQNGTAALCYVVTLTRRDLEKFAIEVGFISTFKRKRLDYFLRKKYTNNVPFGVERCTPSLALRFATFVKNCISELKNTAGVPNEVPESHIYSRYTKHFDIYQFFGLSAKGCYRGCSEVKRWRKALYVNRTKIQKACEHILQNHTGYLSYSLISEAQALLSLSERFFVKVKSVKRTEPKPTYDLVMPETHRFIGNAIVNHNSGKSSTSAVVASYVLHCYLMYPMLASMTNSMQASTELVFIFCSLSYDKAYSVLWTPFKNIIDSAQWYKSYFALLDQYKEQYGKELYVNKSTILAFANKNIKCFATGPKASSLRGNTAIMTLLDELGLFPLPNPSKEVSEGDTNRRADSDEAYTSLLNSLATVGAAQKELVESDHNDAPPCLMLSVSSPVSKRDKVMRLLEESKTNPFIFATRLATWEVNPYLEKDSPLIASAFAADPRKALRDFGACPTETAAPYFDFHTIPKIFNGRPNSHILTYQYGAENSVWGTVRQVNAYDAPTVMALDAGLVNNSFAVAVVGYNQQTNKTETICLLEVMANNTVIDFEKMYTNVLLPLCQQLNVCLVCADRWNSIDHLHRIRSDRGIRMNKPITYVKQYSLKHRDFEAVKAMIANQTITAPRVKPELAEKIIAGSVGDYKHELIDRPVEHFMLQLLTVTDLGPSMCPGKAEGFTDDLTRAWVLAVTMLNKEKVIELVEYNRQFIKKKSLGIGVAVARRMF